MSPKFEPNATVHDVSSCNVVVRGCTNSTAKNYEADAQVDDGTCQYITTGCMSPDADNYNS